MHFLLACFLVPSTNSLDCVHIRSSCTWSETDWPTWSLVGWAKISSTSGERCHTRYSQALRMAGHTQGTSSPLSKDHPGQECQTLTSAWHWKYEIKLSCKIHIKRGRGAQEWYNGKCLPCKRPWVQPLVPWVQPHICEHHNESGWSSLSRYYNQRWINWGQQCDSQLALEPGIRAALSGGNSDSNESNTIGKKGQATRVAGPVSPSVYVQRTEGRLHESTLG